MQSLFGKRGLLFAGLLALTAAAVTPSVLAAKPESGARPRGFRLFARSLGAITINRVYCGLATTGEVCVDSTNSSTIGGGFWPKGTADQYVFNSGLQLAGVIGGTKPTNPWGGDTTGAFFFDPKGTTQHGQQVEPIYNSQNPDDRANWPDAAFVPFGDAGADIFHPVLQRTPAGDPVITASQGDVWWLSWEGNPAQNAGRSHPLGIVVEQRGMGWNFPAGNEDIIYFVYTFYNVTSLNESVYSAIRPGTREIMIRQAQQFHSLNNAAFGITLPAEGYAIENLFAAFAADMDVAEAGTNFSGVVLPFALGHTYDSHFSKPEGWTFDPGIFAPPFFEGSGFVGVKYLKSPTGAGAIQLFSNTVNGTPFAGAVNDPRDTKQLYRYLSGTLSPATGDQPCNTGIPSVTRVCFVNNTDDADMRFFQSSTPLTLGPGEFGSIVVAYIFAAPYKPASYTPGNEVKPGQSLRMDRVDSLNTVGANLIDSIAGMLSYNDANSDGIVQQTEFTVATGSLLGKALVAQAVFDNQFLLPFAPESPDFFLVPGDNQVTVLWQPTATEATGDPFFEIAKSATVIPAGGGDPVPNPLYDPNYRQFDVEGYRVYRGRVDAPNSLSLLAQFDYAGTSILDFSGSINPTVGCAPELNIFTDCAVAYNPAEFVPGVTRTVAHDIPLVGEIIQLKVPGTRAALADGNAIILSADTALTGGADDFPQLDDTGVPFVYVDRSVRNNFRYFYSVTAFDVNSFQSGPSSLESPRVTRSVTPSVGATNAISGLDVQTTLVGRGQTLNSSGGAPALDPAAHTFSGPFPAANGWDIRFIGAVSEVLSGSGTAAARLDSIGLGNAWHDVPNIYYFTATTSAGSFQISIPLIQSFVEPSVTATSTPFPAAAVDPGASRFGGSSAFALYGEVEMTLPGAYFTNSWGRATAFGPQTAGFPTILPTNGPRWFEGANETAPNPNANFAVAPAAFTDWSNAGTLAGVTVIHTPMAYLQGYPGVGFRDFNGVLGGAVRAADYQVYWGAGGALDSVIDITHNVPVPFDTAMGGGWGFLTPASASAAVSDDGNANVVSVADFLCVTPAAQQGLSNTFTCDAAAADDPYRLVETAVISPIQIATSVAGISTAPPPGQQGFGMYMPGFVFIMATDQVPAAGTVWTLRSYIGAIIDDNTFHEEPRTLSAIGAEVNLQYDVTNTVVASNDADLAQVHTVPDPYYVTSEFEQTTDNKVIKFVNLPSAATIRIYSSSGVLVDVIEHNSNIAQGSATWNVRNRNNQVVASGVYFYHIEAGDARRVGRFTIVNFAQ